MITTGPRPSGASTLATDRFFDTHMAGVRARLEAQTRKALERQREAWREMLHREALLDGKEFKPDSD